MFVYNPIEIISYFTKIAIAAETQPMSWPASPQVAGDTGVDRKLGRDRIHSEMAMMWSPPVINWFRFAPVTSLELY